ncbi:hypothetical protein CDL15_Pgr021662 [Punica granatum]|nr:hypothetical protein CDL15_Pgr021662 [Punica granatum]
MVARVAQQMGVELMQEVGCSICSEDYTSEKTILKYMTEGMLLQKFLTKTNIASQSVVIIDEAHESTPSTDVFFGLVMDITRFRPDMKLLISSSTLDMDKTCDFSTHLRKS